MSIWRRRGLAAALRRLGPWRRWDLAGFYGDWVLGGGGMGIASGSEGVGAAKAEPVRRLSWLAAAEWGSLRRRRAPGGLVGPNVGTPVVPRMGPARRLQPPGVAGFAPRVGVTGRAVISARGALGGAVQSGRSNLCGLHSARLAPRTPKTGVRGARPAAPQPLKVAGGWGRVESAARPADSTRTQVAGGSCQATATPGGCSPPGRSELRSLAGAEHPQVTVVRATTASGCSPPDAPSPEAIPVPLPPASPNAASPHRPRCKTPPDPAAISNPPPPTAQTPTGRRLRRPNAPRPRSDRHPTAANDQAR